MLINLSHCHMLNFALKGLTIIEVIPSLENENCNGKSPDYPRSLLKVYLIGFDTRPSQLFN